MPILELKTGKSATRGFLLTAGLGVIFGLFFSVPSAYAVHAMGFSIVPFSAGAILMGLLAGYLLAFLIVTYLLSLPTASVKEGTDTAQPVHRPAKRRAARKSPANALSSRLAEEKASLDRLDIERDFRHDAAFEKITEQRIIWSELLELELQDIDEQIGRICHAADGHVSISGTETNPQKRRST